MANHILSLPFWEGFIVSSVEAVDNCLHVRLAADPGCPLICFHCGTPAPGVHDTVLRTVRDLPATRIRNWFVSR